MGGIGGLIWEWGGDKANWTARRHGLRNLSIQRSSEYRRMDAEDFTDGRQQRPAVTAGSEVRHQVVASSVGRH